MRWTRAFTNYSRVNAFSFSCVTRGKITTAVEQIRIRLPKIVANVKKVFENSSHCVIKSAIFTRCRDILQLYAYEYIIVKASELCSKTTANRWRFRLKIFSNYSNEKKFDFYTHSNFKCPIPVIKIIRLYFRSFEIILDVSASKLTAVAGNCFLVFWKTDAYFSRYLWAYFNACSASF